MEVVFFPLEGLLPWISVYQEWANIGYVPNQQIVNMPSTADWVCERFGRLQLGRWSPSRITWCMCLSWVGHGIRDRSLDVTSCRPEYAGPLWDACPLAWEKPVTGFRWLLRTSSWRTASRLRNSTGKLNTDFGVRRLFACLLVCLFVFLPFCLFACLDLRVFFLRERLCVMIGMEIMMEGNSPFSWLIPCGFCVFTLALLALSWLFVALGVYVCCFVFNVADYRPKARATSSIVGRFFGASKSSTGIDSSAVLYFTLEGIYPDLVRYFLYPRSYTVLL